MEIHIDRTKSQLQLDG